MDYPRFQLLKFWELEVEQENIEAKPIRMRLKL